MTCRHLQAENEIDNILCLQMFRLIVEAFGGNRLTHSPIHLTLSNKSY
jgi:hypothetical protein